jgi:mono/diheme cytochrome c family protein
MTGRLVPLVASMMALAACERGLHEMYDQAKYKPLTPSTQFADGNSSRPQVPGTVPYSSGSAAATSSGRNGTVPVTPAAGAPVPNNNPLPITPTLLARGRERFDIYCAPCHSRAGDGDGMIVRRGFPAPPSYHIERLRNAPDSHFYDVITHGYGVMYPYAASLAPDDRWAVTAYIRALQLSQHAPVSQLSVAELQRLQESRR